MRAEIPSHFLINYQLPTSSPPLQLLSSDPWTDRPEITLPPRKRLGIDLGPRYEIRESLAAATTRPIGGRRVDYGFVGTMDTKIRRQRAEEAAEHAGYHAVLMGIAQDRQNPDISYVETCFMIRLANDTFKDYGITFCKWRVSSTDSLSQLQAAHRRSQVVTSEMLQADHQRQVQLTKALKLLKGLQTQMVEFQRQQGPQKDPAQA
ncbi:hypothetical protein Tco_0327456 [Tanacetum coccineum]